MKPKTGSISLVVLFILTITSLLGLLVFRYLQIMLRYTIGTQEYYRSYYYAKAGLELWLVASQNYGIWFEDAIWWSGDIRKNFVLCAQDTVRSCWFFARIWNRTRNILTAKATNDSVCSSWDAFFLAEGESLVVPLFVDERKISYSLQRKDSDQTVSVLPHQKFMFILPTNVHLYQKNVAFWFSLGSGAQEPDRDVLYKIYTGIGNTEEKILMDFLELPPSLSGSSSEQDSKLMRYGQFANFLLIQNPVSCPWNALNSWDIMEPSKKNEGGYQKDVCGNVKMNCLCPAWSLYNKYAHRCLPSAEVCTTGAVVPEQENVPIRSLSFCLSSESNTTDSVILWLPTQYIVVTSVWSAGEKQVSLEARKKIILPDWLFNTVIVR